MTASRSFRAYVDLRGANLKLDMIDRQTRYAVYLAVNATVDDTKSALRKEMASVFDRPTRMTMDALYGKYASPASVKTPRAEIRGEVGIKDQVGKGLYKLPAIKFLAPQIYGGPRDRKAFEIMLRNRGVLPLHLYAVPGEAMQMDAFGNMNRGQLVQILTYFDTFDASLQTVKNMGTKGRAKLRKGTRRKLSKLYFAVSKPGQNFRPGIWESVRTGFGWSVPRCVIAFVRRPQYSVRFRFHDIGAQVARREFPRNFEWAKRDALRTARLPIAAGYRRAA